MWEVKYLIRLTNGTELQGVLPSKIARVFTGVYCPTGIYPMFSTPTSTSDGYTVQITNFDATYQWTATNAIRSDLTLSGTATSTVSSTGLVTVSGLKPGVTAAVLVTSSKTGVPSQQSAFAASSLSAP
jgi:titin